MPPYDPPYGDEALQRKIKTLYMCIARGCGDIIGEKPRKYCDDHLKAGARYATEKEYEEILKNLKP